MPKNSKIQPILIIGSGPIVIGQACEFDYAGSQASRSLREEGIEVSLINSNPATIMTDEVVADHIYLLPLEVDSLRKILEERKIDAVLPTMGGQTALNLCIEADSQGLWEEYNVEIIGVDIDAINITEDRELSLIHISEPTRRRGISYAVFCLKKKKRKSYAVYCLKKKKIKKKKKNIFFFFFLMIRRPPRSTPLYSSAASDVYKRQ